MMEEASRKSDERIHQAVLRELAWDTRVAPTEVGVQVNRGTVTLTGSVDSWCWLPRSFTGWFAGSFAMADARFPELGQPVDLMG
jgi:hypothetical protein